MVQIKHPYFPRDLGLPNYKPNTLPLSEILGVFFGLVGVLLVGLLVLTRRKSIGTRLKICWFVVCGCIHVILEGYFSVHQSALAGHDTYLGQMWKEYGKGDSRYVTGESCVVGIESITAFIDGPLCFLTAMAYAFHQMSQYRYVFQILVSSFQLYGDSLYYFTEIREGFKHSEFGHPLHFWFYFVFLNAWWIVVPLLCIIDAGWNLAKNQTQVDLVNKTGKSKKKK